MSSIGTVHMLIGANTVSDEACALYWPEGVDAEQQVMPGDNVEMVCEIHNPLAIEQGQRFNVREGGRTVATGLITRIME